MGAHKRKSVLPLGQSSPGFEAPLVPSRGESQALGEADRRLASTLVNLADGFVLFDREWRYIFVNAAAARILNKTPEELLGRVVWEIFPEAARSPLHQHFHRAVEENLAIQFEQYQPGWGWFENRCQPTSSGLAVYFSNITARKQAEEALRASEDAMRRSEARLVQAIRVAGLGTFEHDHRSNLIECSPVLRQMYGLDPDERVTLATILGRVLPEDREALAETIRRAHDPAGSGLYEAEHRVISSGGGIRWVSVRSQTFFEGEGNERRPVRTIGAVLDVTERKECQAGLERLVIERTAKLQEMVTELEHMSYSMIHDLRAPLRAIQGFAELIRRKGGERLFPESSDMLSRIDGAIHQMDQLITDVLKYDQAVRSQLPLRPVDVGPLLRRLMASYAEFQPPKADVWLGAEFPWVLGNAAGLALCLRELLSNAVKFVKPGERPQVRVWAEVWDLERQSVGASARKAPESRHAPRSALHAPNLPHVRIWIEDNGTGILKSGQVRIFDMFQRMHGPEYPGTGIGLALVRKLVERMGGRVGVESEPDHGSRFWVELKAAEPGSQ